MDPIEILERHGLPTAGLSVLSGGTVNLVWSTHAHVLRAGDGADHAREARIALAARRVGVRTPRPVAWGVGYGIWDRVVGRTAASIDSVPEITWNELLDDLELLHAHPPEPRGASAPQTWAGRSHLVESTQPQAGWTQCERDALGRVLGPHRPIRNPAFVHGDAFGRNVLVDDRGDYAALIDWGCAGWNSLEAECARLEDPALDLALRRWHSALDVPLLMSIRLDLFLELAALSRVSFDEIRHLLDRLTA